MLCDECGIRPANVHITKIVNGKTSQLNLCEKCAGGYQQQLGSYLEPNFSLNKFLAGLLNYDKSFDENTHSMQSLTKCLQCGQRYSQFAQSGKLGCEKCYETFGGYVEPLLKRVHGSLIHKGKYPKRTGDLIRLKRELQNLKTYLNELVVKEEFEEAAKIRDQIRDLEKDLDTNKGVNKDED
jgi:protein arginine kinase activator